jgi:hypothetical protein
MKKFVPFKESEEKTYEQRFEEYYKQIKEEEVQRQQLQQESNSESEGLDERSEVHLNSIIGSVKRVAKLRQGRAKKKGNRRRKSKDVSLNSTSYIIGTYYKYLKWFFDNVRTSNFEKLVFI